MESKDIILRKASYEDWKALYQNVWSREETARYMYWRVTTSEEDAKERICKTMEYQKDHDTYLVCDKKSGEPIGFAGVRETEPHVYHETGIALGPEYVGKGYGKQILQLLLEHCRRLGGEVFYYSLRAKNTASRALAVSCGFAYQYSEQRKDLRNGESYVLEVYMKKISNSGP